MKVFYKSTSVLPSSITEEKNYIILSRNNWDDYSYKTTLNACLYIDKDMEFKFELKILISDITYTSEYLDKLCAQGWDGILPIPHHDYISIPSNIDFYKIIQSKLDDTEAIGYLQQVKDASYLVQVISDEEAIHLASLEGFRYSLLRENGAAKAYQDGWKIFRGGEQEIRNFEINMPDKSGGIKSVPFNFVSNLLPYDINVLIGPNGIGKSYCLKLLVEYWLKIGRGDIGKLEKSNHKPFSQWPNFRRMILVSYSPFESFIMGISHIDNLMDVNAYKYFGFRKTSKQGRTIISRDLPKLNAADSLINSIYEDHIFSKHSWWVNKLTTVENALKNALNYDYLAIKIKDDCLNLFPIADTSKINKRHYLLLDDKLASNVKLSDAKASISLEDGVFFIKNNKIIDLSSGQQLFTFIVINVVGAIMENSLVVIDEPELFLHPNLEIEFISLLKDILIPFKSKAILATHSLSIVREVPSNCVHIFRDEGYGLDIVKPPFETFGGDIQRISSYVFGDKSISKPFDHWLEKMVKTQKPEELIESLKDEINEEMIMKIMRLGKKNGSKNTLSKK